MLLLLAGALPTFHAEPGQSESALSALREEVRAVRDPPHNYMDNGDGEIAGVLRTARNSTRPAGGNLEGGWGTDIYTDDSSICTAAAHTGIITRRDGGTVTIKFVAGVTFFSSSTRQGVTSQPADGWMGQSYRFVATLQCTPPPPTANKPLSCAPAYRAFSGKRSAHVDFISGLPCPLCRPRQRPFFAL